MNLDSFPQETSWSSVNQNFLLRGSAFAISWTPFSDQRHWFLEESLIRTLLYCCLLAEPTTYDKTFQTKLTSDQTMVQTIKTIIRPSRTNWPLIRPKSDHGPDYCALQPLSRPCNFGLGTHGCALDWV